MWEWIQERDTLTNKREKGGEMCVFVFVPKRSRARTLFANK